MITENVLLGLTISFPLLGALYLLIFKPEKNQNQRWATVLVLVGAGLASLGRFILSGQVRCTFQAGPESCLQAGILSLSVLLLNGISVYLCLTRTANQRHDFEFFTLLNFTWAAAALADNWVLSMAALSLTLIVTGRWVRARGGSVGFFAGQDDYRDDIGP